MITQLYLDRRWIIAILTECLIAMSNLAMGFCLLLYFWVQFRPIDTAHQRQL